MRFFIVFAECENEKVLVIFERFIFELSGFKFGKEIEKTDGCEVVLNDNGILRVGYIIPKNTQGYLDAKISLIMLSNLFI